MIAINSTVTADQVCLYQMVQRITVQTPQHRIGPINALIKLNNQILIKKNMYQQFINMLHNQSNGDVLWSYM